MVGTVNIFEKFKNYQRDLVSKIKNQKSKLTWNHTYEILTISSIMVITYPCPYKPFFTSTEWNEIMKSNLYKPCQPGLTKAISTSLLKASYNVLLNLDSELNLKDNEIGDKCKRIFNNLKSDLPVIYDAKITEDEHHFHYLNPIIRPIFNDTHENYKLHLNKSVDGSLERPDFSCQVSKIPILNSKVKPVNCKSLRKNKDLVKTHLRSKESINKMIQQKGGPNESIIFLNMGGYKFLS
ncbi:11345_t:CDS:2 [Entrophospora sp. SA101]|nr:11345_t:CDS:2 [Entrophospora sp. SA101]